MAPLAAVASEKGRGALQLRIKGVLGLRHKPLYRSPAYAESSGRGETRYNFKDKDEVVEVILDLLISKYRF
jgi:hypothetical protein